MSLCIWSVCHTQTHKQSNIYHESQWTDWTSPTFPCSSCGWDRLASPLQFTSRSHAFKQRAAMSVYCTKTQQHYNTTTLEIDREREKKKEMRETRRTQKVVLLFWLNISIKRKLQSHFHYTATHTYTNAKYIIKRLGYEWSLSLILDCKFSILVYFYHQHNVVTIVIWTLFSFTKLCVVVSWIFPFIWLSQCESVTH